MKGSDYFQMWAPPDSLWSPWAKPVLFAEVEFSPVPSADDLAWPTFNFPREEDMAIVVDLPGAESVETGLALAENGYRPVPLYNASSGPKRAFSGSVLVDVEPIQRKLIANAERIAAMHLDPKAPPAFLLDWNRKGNLPPTAGKFDNRSIVFPQDFPSANFLLAHGIRRVLLLQKSRRGRPEADLAHVLLRWQQAGIHLFIFDSSSSQETTPLRVSAPSNFQALWYRALAMIGLRRNSTGGFGSIVPEPSSGHSGYRGYG